LITGVRAVDGCEAIFGLPQQRLAANQSKRYVIKNSKIHGLFLA